MTYSYIDKQHDFDVLAAKLKTHKYVSLDTESNSMYVYKEQLCLVQIASEHIHSIVDPLAVDIRGLAPVFADPHIEKIFHSAESDIKTIKNIMPAKFETVFDVMIAAKYLGLQRCGLENMVKEYAGVELNKKFQKADWGKRPLSKEMLDYAIGDVLYLHKIRDIFAGELKKKGLLEEIKGQFADIAALEPGRAVFDENGFLRIHEARTLNGRGLAVLKELYLGRERAAEERNKPPFKIISEELMMRLAIAPKEALENLSIFKGVTGYVLTNHGPWIKDALHRGLKAPEVFFSKRTIAPEKRLHFEGIRERFKMLKAWRLDTANRRNMLPEAVLGNDALEKIAFINPRSVDEIKDIKGFGLEKFTLYAEGIVAALQHKKS